MKKKLFFKLFIFAVIGSLVTMTSCKDYDDDIDVLQGDVSDLSTKYETMKSAQDALTAQVTTLQTAVQNATDATARQNAQAALDKATQALTQVTQIVADITALQTGKVSTADFNTALAAVNKRIDDITPTLNVLIGQITSLVFLPDNVDNTTGVPLIYGVTLTDGTTKIGGTVTLKYQLNPKNAKFVNVKGLVKKNAQTRATGDVAVDIPVSANNFSVDDNGVLTVNVKSTDFVASTSGKDFYAVVIDNSTAGADSRYVYSDYVLAKMVSATNISAVDVTNTLIDNALEVVYDNSTPVSLTPQVKAGDDGIILNNEGFVMGYKFEIDQADEDKSYFTVDQATGKITVVGGYAAVGKSVSVKVTVTTVNGVTLSTANQKSKTVSVKAVASAPTTGDLGTVTKSYIYGSKTSFEESVFNLADFARIANRPTTDFSSGYTDKIFDGTNDVTSNYSGNIALSADGKLTVTPDGTNNLSLDKVYTLKRTYSFDSGRQTYVATVNVTVTTPTFVSNKIPAYWSGSLLKTKGSIVNNVWTMSSDLKNAYATGPINIQGSTTSNFTDADMQFSTTDANVTISGNTISLKSSLTAAQIQEYMNGKNVTVTVKVAKGTRTFTLETIQVQFVSPLTITVTPVSFKAADGNSGKIWSQAITINGIDGSADSNLTSTTSGTTTTYTLNTDFLTKYGIDIANVVTGNPNLQINFKNNDAWITDMTWITYNNNTPLASDLTGTYNVVVKYGPSGLYQQTVQLPVTVLK